MRTTTISNFEGFEDPAGTRLDLCAHDPEHMPHAELRLSDPDWYVLPIGQPDLLPLARASE